jgi:quercetin dioxygenase-like cupin family protein
MKMMMFRVAASLSICLLLPIAVTDLAVRPSYSQQFPRGHALPSIAKQESPTSIRIDPLLQTNSSWDGTPCKAYPPGKPQVSVFRITIAPHSILKWHSHPVLNAAYVLSGNLTIEKKDGTKRRFKAGEAIAELVDGVHRGITGDDSVTMIVFCAGAANLPFSQPDPTQ